MGPCSCKNIHMIKTCSLNFINNEYFDTDVMTKDGRVLFSAEEKVTPELILRLYFKDIYVKEKPVPVAAVVEQEQAELQEETKDLSVKAGINAAVNTTERELGIKASIDIYDEDETEKQGIKMPRMTIGSAPLQQPSEISEGGGGDTEPEDPILEFDEEKAKKVAADSVKLGKMFNFSDSELKTLEQAAYYHNIGINKFKKSDSTKRGFRKKLAEVSYNILLNEMGMQTIVAETAKFCVNNYEPKDFSLQEKIPFHQIVAVTSYYEALYSKTSSKEKSLAKMLQLGGNKFNTFVLHKFITIMKDSDD